MSYDDRKIRRDQEFYEEVELVLDACKYSLYPYTVNEAIVGSGPFSASYTGSVPVSALSPGSILYTTWGGLSNLYVKFRVSGEIASITITSILAMNITARGLFGTTAAIIQSTGNANEFTILHQGEADQSCRGYPHTCSSSDSYDPAAKIRPIFSSGQAAGGTLRFAGLRHKSCKHKSCEIDPGESIGTRASFSCQISDQRHNDFGLVPYPQFRTENGTLFGKMLARHPYMQGRELIHREYLRDAGSFEAGNYIERRYLMDSVKLSGDTFMINAVDPLILTEDKKAKMPIASPARLSAAISGTPATFSYIDAPDYYFGPMSSTRWVRIDAEVIEVTVSSATQLTVVTRGYKSVSKNHDAGASIQDCIRFSGTNGIDAIVFALENYTSTPAAFVDDYSATIALLPDFNFDEAFITKPMPVIEFINMVIKLGNLEMYFNEETQLIVINYTPEDSIEPVIIDGFRHLERGTITLDQNSREQWTRHSHLWAPVDITKDTEENFAIRYLQVNAGLEDVSRMGEVNEKKEFKNMLLTTSPDDSLIGTTYVNRLLAQTDEPPKIIEAVIRSDFVGANDGGNVSLGSIVSLSTQESQDKDGIGTAELYRVVRLDGNAYTDYKAKFKRYISTIPPDVGETGYTITGNHINFDLSTVFAPVSAGTYSVLLDASSTIGSYTTATSAFTTGTQASGVVIRLINRGKILAKGGDGGNAGIAATPAGQGATGGTAIDATCEMIIDTGSGLIWAGGGGGRGQAYVSPQGPGPAYITRAGGGGGQGFSQSKGGFDTDGIAYTVAPAVGNQSSPGITPLPGGNGGEWGEDGEATDGSIGALAGEAIKSNGNTITITSGNNEFNIRGRRT